MAVIYSDIPDLGDVMHEQLDFLLAHGPNCVVNECIDCLRYQQVKVGLMRPFEARLPPQMTVAQLREKFLARFEKNA